MTLAQWLPFAVASAILVAIPGPTVLLVVSFKIELSIYDRPRRNCGETVLKVGGEVRDGSGVYVVRPQAVLPTSIGFEVERSVLAMPVDIQRRTRNPVRSSIAKSSSSSRPGPNYPVQ